MRTQHHVIYVPGTLDDIYHAQGLLVRLWRLHGAIGHCHEIPWAGGEPWHTKFQRLLAEIDSYHKNGHKVSLVGASAGASAVLNAYAARRADITGVVYICAKINGPETVGSRTYARNPAFKESLYALQDELPKFTSEDKAKMLSLYSPTDKTVPYAATVISGVKERSLPEFNHGKAILYSLSFGYKDILGFLKSR